MRSDSRVLIAELDSPAQAERFARLGARTATVELTGMLRIGVLVSETVLVTEAMLLDGAYFLALGPEGVLSELGASGVRHPLTITGTSGSLSAGLQSRLDNPGFKWSLPGVVSTSEIPSAIRNRWDEWLAAVESGFITYETQSRDLPPMRTGPVPIRTEAALQRVMASGLGDIRFRSDAWRIIDELDLFDDERTDVRRWWNDAYLRMIAENAEADWISFDTDTATPLALGPRDVELPLSSALIAWARGSSPATVAVARDASREQQEQLRRRPDWTRMRNLAFSASQVTATSSRPGVLYGSYAKLAIALVLVALALPGLDVGAIDSPLTWIAFVGVVATTVPFDSLWALVRLLAKEPRARLVLHTRGTA